MVLSSYYALKVGISQQINNKLKFVESILHFYINIVNRFEDEHASGPVHHRKHGVVHQIRSGSDLDRVAIGQGDFG